MNFYYTDEDFITNRFHKFMFILFDILYYLGVNYGFNHNDLHFGNVMVVEAKDYDITEYKSLNDHNFTIINPKYVPVIIDFDWATFIPPKVPPQVPPKVPQEIKKQIKAQLEDYTCNEEEKCTKVLFRCTHNKYKNYNSFGSFASDLPVWSPYVDSAFFIECARCAQISNVISTFEGVELHIFTVLQTLASQIKR